MKYEIVFLDHGGKAFSRAEMQAEDDKSAIELADRIHRSTIGSGYEIRRGGLTIHVEEYGPSLPPKAAPAGSRRASSNGPGGRPSGTRQDQSAGPGHDL